MSAATLTKRAVSERGLIGRINRKLAAKGQTLRKDRSAIYWRETKIYLIEDRKNVLERFDRAGLEKLAREINALAEWEELKC
jgi:hypothetical protein